MLKITKNKDYFCFILENLRDEDLEELRALWGEQWKEKTLESLEKTEVLVIFGNDGEKRKIPIAMGGFYDMSNTDVKIACVWLLTTKFIKYNRRYFISSLVSQIEKASLKYDILFNFIYKSNFQAKQWLKKLGFCFDKKNPTSLVVEEGFEFFYKKRKEY